MGIKDDEDELVSVEHTGLQIKSSDTLIGE